MTIGRRWMMLALVPALGIAPAVAAQDGQAPIAMSRIGLGTVQDALAALQREGTDDRTTKGATAPMPIGGAAQWIRVGDYPAAAIRAGEQGRTVAMVAVDAHGQVTGCSVASSSGSASLDEATCRIAQTRMKFTPAHDHGGRAIAGEYRLPVVWRLPDNAAAMAAVAGMVTTLVSVGEDGTVLSCTTQSAAPAADICAAFPKGQKVPGLDAMKGKVVMLATFMRPLAE